MVTRMREKYKTLKTVFDQWTERNIWKLISQGQIDSLDSPLAIGKEGNVFIAKKGDDQVIVKIYRLENCDFNRMYENIRYDLRYLALRKSKRQVIFAWAGREYRNLHLARTAGVSVPMPISCIDNILVMELIGRNQAAPKLKDLPPQDPKLFCKKVITQMRLMHKSGMVHGDLSEFNILNNDEDPVFIDYSQASPKGSANYPELFVRDVKNMCAYFRRQGVKITEESMTKKITS